MSLGSFFPGFDFDSPSNSISVGAGFPNVAFSLSRAMSKDFAAGLVDGYVSVMTCARISGVRRLRIEEIDRSARRVNLASNNVTALSNNGKLLLISIMKRAMSVSAKCNEKRCLRTSYSLGNWINLRDPSILAIQLFCTIHSNITIGILRDRSGEF
jgi:hypothetical protein